MSNFIELHKCVFEIPYTERAFILKKSAINKVDKCEDHAFVTTSDGAYEEVIENYYTIKNWLMECEALEDDLK